MKQGSWAMIFAVIASIGCSSPERDTGQTWDFEEGQTRSASTSGPEEAVQPPPEDGQDVVILHPSPGDPYFGTAQDFYRDTPYEPSVTKKCPAVMVGFDLETQPGEILVLPSSITRTSKKFGLEYGEYQFTSWVWMSDIGPIWANWTPIESFAPPRMVLSAYPYSASYPSRPEYEGFDGLIPPPCPPVPEELTQIIQALPSEIEVEIWVNGQATALTLKLETIDGLQMYRKAE